MKKLSIKILILLVALLAIFLVFRYLEIGKIIPPELTKKHNSTINNTTTNEIPQTATESSPILTEQQENVVRKANIGDSAEDYDKPFDINNGFADLAQYATPSVVNISALKVVKTSAQDAALENVDPALRELFKQLMPNNNGAQQNQSFVSLGSGFVVRSDGFIVTNYHVIQDAQNIQVTFTDGKKYNAELYATDAVTDIALLKVEANDLKSLKFGDSDAARVGDWVIAIGNPFGLSGTVSSGIISATGRDISINSLSDFIQTDAAINKGNSGGPMINTRGEVIGINTAIFSTSGGSIGIGFAVPSRTIKTVISQLITSKKVVRGWLGVQVQGIDDNLAKSLKLDNTEGALISGVLPGSPAETAGLKSGDVVYSVNGQPVKNSRVLPRIVTSYPPNSVITLSILSNGLKKDVKVTIGNIPEQVNGIAQNQEDNSKDNSKVKEKTYDDIGLKVAEINPALRKHFNLPEKADGLVVIAVKVGSVLQAKGLTSGLRIISVNQKEIKTLDQLDTVLNGKDENLLFLLEDLEEGKYFVSVTKKEIKQGYLDDIG